MLGETILHNGKRYIIVSELGNQMWLFEEETAITCIANEEMLLVIDKEELEEIEADYENIWI